MKKHILSAILLGGLLSGPLGLEARRRSIKEVTIYEKDVWAKGLPAAKKKLWYKQPLTKQEQMYFDSLKKRVRGGVSALVAILVSVYGRKKYLEQKRLAREQVRELERLERQKRLERLEQQAQREKRLERARLERLEQLERLRKAETEARQLQQQKEAERQRRLELLQQLKEKERQRRLRNAEIEQKIEKNIPLTASDEDFLEQREERIQQFLRA